MGPILDQGREGACVGFGWVADALATPTAVNLARLRGGAWEPEAFAKEIYRNAQRIDEWEGENYEGTSVLAGAKAMGIAGLIKEYRWAFSIDDVIDAVLVKGPAVLGIPWFSGMYEAPGGVLSVTGNVVGGHCITAVGYHKATDGSEDSIILQNSWGSDWGTNGLARIKISELARLLKEGEACIPTRRSFGR